MSPARIWRPGQKADRESREWCCRMPLSMLTLRNCRRMSSYSEIEKVSAHPEAIRRPAVFQQGPICVLPNPEILHVAKEDVAFEHVLEQRVDARADRRDGPDPLARLDVDGVADQVEVGAVVPQCEEGFAGVLLIGRVAGQPGQSGKLEQERARCGGASLLRFAFKDAVS
jgi:hypothetical protein